MIFYKMACLKYSHKHIHGNLPVNLQTMVFPMNKDFHDKNTRGKLGFRLPNKKCGLTFSKIKYKIPKFRNHLSSTLKEKLLDRRINISKSYYKKTILETYKENCTDRNCYVCKEIK